VAFPPSPSFLGGSWACFRPGRQPPLAKTSQHITSTVPLHQGDGHAGWPGRFCTVLLCAVRHAPS